MFEKIKKKAKTTQYIAELNMADSTSMPRHSVASNIHPNVTYVTHTHTHTHAHTHARAYKFVRTYIYKNVCVCVCVCTRCDCSQRLNL